MRAPVVQFPHPRAEHNAGKKQPVFPWNTGSHGRKFMRSPGQYVDVHGAVHDDRLVFWGEWEAPSRVVRTWEPSGVLPRYLHEPYWESPGPAGFRQNTDPWVFGDRFRYSNCKQLSQKALRNLPSFALVLFGSTLGGRFVLDTCFVAAGSVAMEDAVGLVDRAFEVCTIDSLGADATHFRVHWGATPSDPVNGMYSFTPCLTDSPEGARFSRPVIQLPAYINPAATMAPRGGKTQRPPEEVHAVWEEVARQVRRQGLELGTLMRTPPLVGYDPGPRASRDARRARC